MRKNSFFFLVCLGIAQHLPAQAQTNNQGVGETYSIRYSDWLFRCATVETTKTCEIVQTLGYANNPGTAALMAIGRSAKGEPLRFVFQLPSNVTIAPGISVEFGKEKPVKGEFRRCGSGGCIGDFVFTDEMRKSWPTRTQAGTIAFVNFQGTPIKLPLSFNGLGPALERLMKEP